MRIRPYYAAFTALVLVAEIGIAAFMHDGFVRPYLGDSLAVALVYFGLRAIAPLGIVRAMLVALAIAVAIELGQLFGLLWMLGLDRNPIARVVLGTGYDPRDFIAYGAGAAAVAVGEAIRRRRWR